MPARPSSRPMPERLVPPKGTAVAALWARLPSIPTPRIPSSAADCHSRAGIPPPSGSAALGPLREPGDVIRVVLVPHDPDSLAAFVLEALTQDLLQQAGDIVPAAGLGKQLVGDQGAHQCIPLLFPY